MRSFTSFTVQVPASSANLGPGFDTFGLALAWYNRFTFEPCAENVLNLSPESTVSMEKLSTKPSENLVFRAYQAYFRSHGLEAPTVAITAECHIPLSRGMGSSSSAIVGGLMGAQRVAGHEFHPEALLQLACELEGHADNTNAALLGKLTISNTPNVEPLQLDWPEDWGLIVAIPQYELSTEKARKALPKAVSMEDAVWNIQKVSRWITGLLSHDAELFANGLSDRLHEPYRQPLIPDYLPVSVFSRDHGAIGVTISGAGPTLLIFIQQDRQDALYEAFLAEQQSLFPKLDFHRVPVDTLGAHIL